MPQNQDLGFAVAILSLGCEAKDETQQEVDDCEEHWATLLPPAGQNANRKFLHPSSRLPTSGAPAREP